MFGSHPNSYVVITTKFYTCHDNCAVAACANICSYLMIWKGMTAKMNSMQIKSTRYFVKWAHISNWRLPAFAVKAKFSRIWTHCYLTSSHQNLEWQILKHKEKIHQYNTSHQKPQNQAFIQKINILLVSLTKTYEIHINAWTKWVTLCRHFSVFSWKKIFAFSFKFHWNWALRVKFTIS